MKRTQRILMGNFIITIVVVIAFVILFETGYIATGLMVGDNQTEFLFTTIMELVTLAFIFLALRLFKFKSVHTDLIARKDVAMLKWGFTRMMLLQAPLWFNTLLYYLYMNTTFGYMAIILALCLPFVYPSMNRCIAETTEE